jgi:TPR repeat protein
LRLVVDSLPKVLRALQVVGVAPVEALKGVWIDVYGSTVFNFDAILPPGLRPAYEKARDAIRGPLDAGPLMAELLAPIREGVDRGEPAMALLLAHLHRHGFGVPEDEDQALRLTRLAAETGELVAASILGDMLLDGVGTLPDYGEALVWLRRALPLDANKTLLGLWRIRVFRPDLISDAESVQGLIIASSRGDAMARSIIDDGMAEQNLTVEDWRRIARHGEAYDWVSLARVLLFGPPGRRDEIDGVEALRFAARWQDERAARLLSRLYREGACGLGKDEAKAEKWALAAKRFEKDTVKRGPRKDVIRYRTPGGWKTLDMNADREGRAGRRKKRRKPQEVKNPPTGE